MRSRTYIINTYAYTLTHSAERCLGELADLGFDTFELMMYPGHAWPAELDHSRRQDLHAFLRRHSLSLRSLNQPNIDINLAAATEEGRGYSVDIVGRIIELAADLGAADVILGPGKVNPLMPSPVAEATTRFYRSLDVLLPRANALGVRLLVENMPFAFLPAIGPLMDAVDTYGADEIGIIYDIANAHFIMEDIQTGLDQCRRRLKLVHLSDTGTELYRHDPVGTGTVNFARAAEQLAALGWNEAPVLEIIGLSKDPGAEITASARKLDAAGWQRFSADVAQQA